MFRPLLWLSILAFLAPHGLRAAPGDGPRLDGWFVPEFAGARPRFEIRGTNDRNNPLRHRLSEPFAGDELFVHFQLRYDADSIDTAAEDEGEFFVLWLDNVDGGDRATHSGGVPNIGVHVAEDGKNKFMARFDSSQQSFSSVDLEGDREFTVVSRLWKSVPGASLPFDRLDLWIDPERDAQNNPDATSNSKRSISSVKWIGFSTGRKTEPTDRIEVWDIGLARTWEEALGLPPKVVPVEPEEPIEYAKVDPPPEEIETDHWSFQPIQRPAVPKVKRADWVRTPVDAFIARQHEKLGLQPAPPADAATLTRRLSLDLTGLPPKPGKTPTDFDVYVDDLLASHAYGERWGRHWLDVARWAESNGHQHNRDRPNAWRYRDYVIDSFNSNKPYDQFIREQIAGDELPAYADEHIVATGFLAAARYSGNELDKQIQRNDILVDIVNATSKAFLGLTMECAQCHDHFFDPVTQWDYYNMQAFFAQGQPGDVILQGEAEELVEERHRLFESVRARLVENLRRRGAPEPVLVINKNVVKGMTRDERARYDALEAKISKFPKAWAFYSPITARHDLEVAQHEMRWPLPPPTEANLENQVARFLVRGAVEQPGPIAEPAWPQVLGPTPVPGEHPRLTFANWLTSPNNPLTARVWVNRIWQWHFGRGLVETSGDFGVKGAEPTHPELLDWLASELIDSGWNTRHIHHLILQSNTYRQSSLFSASNADRDPGNSMHWRWKPRRLEAEAIRDSILTVAGRLEPASGGLSVSESSQRRSLYLKQKRDNLPHQQKLFDTANAIVSCSRRRVSTVALQPLYLLNSDFMQQMAAAFANRVADEATEPETQAALAIELALARPAEPEEVKKLTALLQESDLKDVCLALLNTNEFLYLP